MSWGHLHGPGICGGTGCTTRLLIGTFAFPAEHLPLVQLGVSMGSPLFAVAGYVVPSLAASRRTASP